jgi:aminopeptidase N
VTHTTYRKDYQPFSHRITSVDLDFVLDPENTLVRSCLQVEKQSKAATNDLVLNASELTFISLAINGKPVNSSRYTLTDTTLTIHAVPPQCRIDITNSFSPARNTILSGIYMSRGAFMSQCESEGFRRITYWPDRPDVMSVFSVTIHARKDLYPVLLSNGNLVDSGDEPDGMHYAVWKDPFKKPSYLFALVAGDLKDRSEKFTLKNGKEVLLQIWAEERNYERSAHALESLKKAIRWDEERFGLELDLDRFMIVATDDFNFGAMENKGLNIFNSRYVMASPETATDQDYLNIESVVGHEYFHNWTGDRVTLRDWFQLTLKEGLTVFRDQEFSMDMAPDASTRAVLRIQDVRSLRSRQFPEDAGPMAHPIRPDSYEEINNFYTMTVYEKGAEVIRMLQTILGKEGFRKGMDLYIKRHDGNAVTCDDFLSAMSDANRTDLQQFALWYSQAGTPRVAISTQFDVQSHTYTVQASQMIPGTPGQPAKEPMLIPISIGLIDQKGVDLPLTLAGESACQDTTRTLLLTEESMSWTFINIPDRPYISIGRGFSAPVVFDYAYTRDELAFLAKNDSDAFNRAEAMERLCTLALNRMIDEIELGQEPHTEQFLLNAFETILKDESLSPMFRAVALELPSEQDLGQSRAMINPTAIHVARQRLIREIGDYFSQDLAATVAKNKTGGPYSHDAADSGKRMLKNLCMSYWLAGGSSKALLDARSQFDSADNLTDKLAALTMIVNSKSPAKIDVLNAAIKVWANDPLLVNKWITVQTTAVCHEGEMPILERIQQLSQYPAVFSLENPNSVYAMVLSFMTSNPAEFHREDGSGYQYWYDMVTKLDTINPHVASRIARVLNNWRRYDPERAAKMHEALVAVSSIPTLSPHVREVVMKALNNP